MMRRLVTLMTAGALGAVVLIYLNPVSSGGLRLGWLAALGLSWAGLLFLAWRRGRVRCLLVILPVLIVAPLLLPARELNQDDLESRYLKELSGFDGSPYHWGGEDRRGIDCSGLPRRALRNALISYGLLHADGRALRLALEQWWHDSSAKALGEGYRDWTHSLGRTGTVKAMDYAGLEAGDLAVTKGGAHVLCYLGDGRWIQADPGLGKVATLDGRKDANYWFESKVSLHRWQVLMKP